MAASAAFSQQDNRVWVQIEAHPSLTTTQERIRNYAARLQDVNGFSLGGGWYGIALGPYLREDARQVLRVLRAEGTIPRDSYIAYSSSFRQQFWPVGANALAAQPVAPTAPAAVEQDSAAATPVAPEPREVDETPRQARASEALLNREERKELQIALKWAGVYTSTIDGAFGRGTRASMAAWQADNGYERTGVLTTKQRAVLLGQYNAVLDGLGLRVIREEQAGIEMKLPMDVVQFSKYEPPFAHFDPTGDIQARILLISQKGDQNTLFGLYDIMQTLEIVPEEGPRERRKNSFMLVGLGADFISHTQASLENGMVKGFTLIWPAGDEERRTRLLGEMQKSFVSLPGALDPAAGANDEQRIDLVSGLEIRKPRLSRSGFYIDSAGTVVTTALAVDTCRKVTIDDEIEAEIVAIDELLGVAVLRPTVSLVPQSIAAFQKSTPRLQSEVAVSGYSYEGILGAPTLTFGHLADLRGLSGEEQLKRIALASLPGDAGGPVFDAGGAVLGMLLPRLQNNGRQLPQEVSFVAAANAIEGLLAQAGLQVSSTSDLQQIAPEDLTTHATGMTVLVSCWN